MCPGVFSVPQTDPSSVPAVSRGRLERDREGPRARLVPGFGVAPKVIGRRGVGPMHRDYVGRPESAPDELDGPAHPRLTILGPLELSHEVPVWGGGAAGGARAATVFQRVRPAPPITPVPRPRPRRRASAGTGARRAGPESLPSRGRSPPEPSPAYAASRASPYSLRASRRTRRCA